MKKFVPALMWALSLPLFADVGAWVGYVTYAPAPIAASVATQDNDLTWLTAKARSLPKDGVAVLGRRDADHWMALTNRDSSWVLQIHDETSKFNFRASIQPKTGKILVEKGVDWAGLDRNADAERAATLALGYLGRARMAQDLFPDATTSMASATKPPVVVIPAVASPMMPDPPMVSVTMASTSVVREPMKTQDSLIPDPMLGNGGADLWLKLVDGNLRFLAGKVLHPNQSMERVDQTAQAQHPFAIVVSCSDSRVPPEVLFDQGIGDLFVIRTAGEVVTEVELGSIEYAVEHLGVGYLVVMGHKRCGAVDATLKGGDLPPNIEAVAAQIRPAVEAARFMKGDLLDNAVRENTKVVLAKIQSTPVLSEALHSGKLNLKAAYYDIDTGKVAALP